MEESQFEITTLTMNIDKDGNCLMAFQCCLRNYSGLVRIPTPYIVVSQSGLKTYHLPKESGRATLGTDLFINGYVTLTLKRDPDFTYLAGVAPDRESTPPSDRWVPLCLGLYENFRMILTGERVEFAFTPPPKLSYGKLTISPMGEAPMVLQLDHRVTQARLDTSLAWVTPDNLWTATLRAAADRTSDGPASRGVLLFNGLPELLGVSLLEKTLRVDCRLTPLMFERRRQCILHLALLLDGAEVFLSPEYPMAQEEREQVTLQLELNPEQCAQLRHCTLAVYSGGCGGLNKTLGDANTMSLAVPQVRLDWREGNAVLSWDGTSWSHYRILRGSGDTVDVMGPSHTLSGVGEVQETVVVACLFDGALGPYSDPISLLRPGYYPTLEGGELVLTPKTGAAERAYRLGGGLFLAEPGEPVVVEPFRLEKRPEGWYLTVEGDAGGSGLTEAFERFLAKLEDCGLKPSAHYLVREVAARCACTRSEEALTYLCGMRRGGRVVSLFPGVTLRMESAVFQPRRHPYVDDSGYVPGPSQRYWVDLAEQDGGETLSLDACLERVLGPWGDAPDSNQGASGLGGLMDFLRSDLRAPYGRVYYPEAFHSSKQPGTEFVLDNISLAFSPSYARLGASLEDLAGTGLPLAVPRGRSTLTLEISVLINAQVARLPLGTTLAALLRSHGLRHRVRQTRLFRQTGVGEFPELEVFLERLEDESSVERLPLLPGDRILLCGE